MFHVKHDEQYTLTATHVQHALSDAGVQVTRDQAQLLVQHAELVLEANQTMNLTRITAPPDVIDRHIVDSLAFLPLIKPLEGRTLDMGSGAGYPGIPLAILGTDIALCESIRKKAAFLESAVAALGMHCPVFSLRAEELALREPRSFNAVVARAVSALPALVELSAPLLTAGGLLVALKGSPQAKEELDAQYASKLCGLQLLQRHEYQLPLGEVRTVFVYQRVKNPSIRLPRRPGMAQRDPIVTSGT